MRWNAEPTFWIALRGATRTFNGRCALLPELSTERFHKNAMPTIQPCGLQNGTQLSSPSRVRSANSGLHERFALVATVDRSRCGNHRRLVSLRVVIGPVTTGAMDAEAEKGIAGVPTCTFKGLCAPEYPGFIPQHLAG